MSASEPGVEAETPQALRAASPKPCPQRRFGAFLLFVLAVGSTVGA